MAQKHRNAKEQRSIPLQMGKLKTRVLVVVFIALAIFSAGVVPANDFRPLNHVATTYAQAHDSDSPWKTAEMVCCHCYSTKSDGTRFYHGVLEAGFCRSQRGYCEGYAKCFP